MGVLVAMNRDLDYGGCSDECEGEEYTDGLPCDAWIEDNSEWLGQITDFYEIHRQIYEAVHEQDWRPVSCGGCL